MAVNIGAKIGIDGWKEYRDAMSSIVAKTKELASESKLLDTSFGGNAKTISDVAKQENLLQKQLGVLNDAYQEQLKLLNDVRNEYGESSKEADNARANLNKTATEIENVKQKLNDLPSAVKLMTTAFREATSDVGELLKGVGTSLTKYVTVPLAGFATLSVKDFASWQSAFAGVKKTVEGTPEQLNAIGEGIKDIALNTASSVEDIAAVAEAAGQLGISTDGVVKFTKTMVMLGDSTNLSADEAAIALARVINITGETEDNIDRIGASIVDLGNNFATSESEIVAMTNRLAAGGTLAGLTTQEILGLATAMSSVGITAEAGGTAMTQTLTAIEKEWASFSTGAESDLPRIAEIANMSADEFATAWKENPIKAIEAFISGLGNLDEKGESATLVLDELGMSGIRQSNMLKSLALASDVLTDAIQVSTTAYEENVALTNEASQRYETFDSKINQLKESWKIFTSTIGETIVDMVLPFIEQLTQGLERLSDWWQNLSPMAQQLIIIIGGIVAAVGPVLAIAGNVLIWISKIQAALGVFGTSLGTIASTIGGSITSVLGGINPIFVAIGVAIAGVTAILHHFGYTWGDVWNVVKEAFELVKNALVDGWHYIEEDFANFKNFISEKATSLVNWVKEKWNDLKNSTIEIFTTIKTKAIEIFENIKTGVVTKVSNIKNAIVDGFNNAVEFIKNLGSQAWSWGADMINGFVNGIKSKISAVTDAVSGIANKVKSFLHFSEPDEGPLSHFNDWMPDMMRQMAAGINDNAYLVEDAMNNLTNGMASSVGNSVNYGGVVINLSVGENTNGVQLVDEIENELANRTIRRRAVFN